MWIKLSLGGFAYVFRLVRLLHSSAAVHFDTGRCKTVVPTQQRPLVLQTPQLSYSM